jgi:hypothetical protein
MEESSRRPLLRHRLHMVRFHTKYSVNGGASCKHPATDSTAHTAGQG